MMKIPSIVLIVFLAGPGAFGQDLLVRISNLSWLSGCWENRGGSSSMLVSENWMQPAGTSILGAGRTVENEKTTDYEFMRIEVRGSNYFFVALPKGNASETTFKMRSMQPQSIVFENKEHDFPQQVSYRRDGDKLFARIEGNKNGKTMAVDFSYEKVSCD